MYNRPPKVGALYGYAAAQLIAKAYQKAGKVDKEKFITAMEGLTVDSPVGKLEMRKCDHQLMLRCSSVLPRLSSIRLPHCRQYYDNSWQGLLTNL